MTNDLFSAYIYEYIKFSTCRDISPYRPFQERNTSKALIRNTTSVLTKSRVVVIHCSSQCCQGGGGVLRQGGPGYNCSCQDGHKYSRNVFPGKLWGSDISFTLTTTTRPFSSLSFQQIYETLVKMLKEFINSR